LLKIHGRGFAAPIGLELIGNALILLQGAHAGTFDGRDVNERVVAAALGRDKAIALVGIEEFDGSGGQMGNPLSHV
jgi:hypothetical protein